MDTIVASNGTLSVGTTTSVNFPRSLTSPKGRDIAISRLTGPFGQTYVYGGSGDDVVTAGYLRQRAPIDLSVEMSMIVGYLSRLISSTYHGGSRADELTVMRADAYGNLFVGGAISSHDFPVESAVQPKYGGGAEDAILLHFEAGGDLHHATYLGGSGSDRILGLFILNDMAVTASGQTTPSDFPTVAADQVKFGGNTDGFVTRIGTNLIGISEPLIGGNGLRVYKSVSIGVLNGSSAAPVLVTGGDPSVVGVSANYDENLPTASVILPGGGRLLSIASRAVEVRI